MNYQRFFSRFYSAGDQHNGEMSQKYVLLTSTNTTSETNEFIDFQQQFEDRDNEEVFENTAMNREVPETWNVPSPEETPVCIELLATDEVRWFYKLKDEKVWTEFNGYDSLLIEEKYRLLPPSPSKEDCPQSSGNAPLEESTCDPRTVQQEEIKIESHSSKLKEDFGEFSPRRFLRFSHKSESGASYSAGKTSVKSDSESSEDSWNENTSVDINKDRIVVRGGLYEVDLAKMTCESIYWPGEKHIITRGLYFYDGSWQPLERCHGEVVEAEHLRLFRNANENTKSGTASTGIAVHRQDFPEFHIEWMSCNEIYLYWGGAPRQLVRSVTQKLGFYQSTGYRLRRGYRTRASMAEKPADITHVIFVVHGIGQKMDEGRGIRNTNALRSIMEWLRLHYPTGGEGRAELFPARWSAGTRGKASGLLAAAAPPGAPALRRAINDAAMDVMYYTSPLYGKQIQDDLRKELNRLYTMFMARNPNYKGQFSGVAHSLGSVIMYDLVIDYQIGCDHCAGTRPPVKQKLLFSLQHLFCIGSPIGVFLAMRHPNPSLNAVLPKEMTSNLYNIFHSSDPVAYRLEPLISPCQANQPPVIIPSYDTSPANNVSSPARSTWKIWSYVKHPWHKPSEESMQRNENESPSHFQEDKIDNSLEEEELIIQSEETGSCSHDIVGSILNKDLPFESIEPRIISDRRSHSDALSCVTNKIENGPRYQSVSSTIARDLEEHQMSTNVVVEEVTETSLFVVNADKFICPDARDLNDKSPQNSKCSDPKDSKIGEVLPYRLDYTIRDSGMANNYISAITSHTSYWNNYDVAQFILSNLSLNTKDEVES